MQSVIQGRIFKFGDNINSDIIIPGRYLIYIDREKLGEHAFEMLGQEVREKLKTFDILVAGRNFGCGSAREQISHLHRCFPSHSFSKRPPVGRSACSRRFCAKSPVASKQEAPTLA